MRNTDELRIWIAVRSDLEMPPGKLAAQVAHAASGAVWHGRGREDVAAYMRGAQTKIVVSDDDLDATMQAASDAGVPALKIVDAGRTVFGGPTATCVAIGPIAVDKCPERVRGLKLL